MSIDLEKLNENFSNLTFVSLHLRVVDTNKKLYTGKETKYKNSNENHQINGHRDWNAAT